jgi:hypothetical protein
MKFNARHVLKGAFYAEHWPRGVVRAQEEARGWFCYSAVRDGRHPRTATRLAVRITWNTVPELVASATHVIE